MVTYALRRIPSALGVLFGASIVVFVLLRLIPGDPALTLAGSDATPEAVEALRQELGLDGSQVAEYFRWVGGLLTFDPGQSIFIGGDIADLIADAAVNTLVLAGAALALSILIALTLSIVSVSLNRRWLNSFVSGFSALGVAVPSFVTGVVFVLFFAVVWRLLPAGGQPPGGLLSRPDITAQYLVLPAVCLALPSAAALTRFITEALRSQLEQPYVVTARALGIPRGKIVRTQALRNALPPAVTVLGLQVGRLLGGAVIVESIFAWPGLGHLLEQAISRRDYPTVQVLLLLTVAAFVVVQVATDLINAWLDPRVRLGGGA